MAKSKSFAILKAKDNEGSYLPFSIEIRVCLVTSNLLAKSSDDIFLSFLISASLFLNFLPPRKIQNIQYIVRNINIKEILC